MEDTEQRLDIFSDYTWPYCYFITGSIDRLEKEFNIAVRWRCFPLHPEVPTEGMLLTKMFNRSPQEIEAWAQGFRKKASRLGLPFGPWQKIFNTAPYSVVDLSRFLKTDCWSITVVTLKPGKLWSGITGKEILLIRLVRRFNTGLSAFLMMIKNWP